MIRAPSPLRVRLLALALLLPLAGAAAAQQTIEQQMTPEQLKQYLENLRPEDFGKFNI